MILVSKYYTHEYVAGRSNFENILGGRNSGTSFDKLDSSSRSIQKNRDESLVIITSITEFKRYSIIYGPQGIVYILYN